MDLSGIYTSRTAGSKGEVKAKPIQPGARPGYDLGIAGMRAFAADYSGASGAPGLFVVVDQVSGTSGKNTWQLVTEKQHAVTAAGNTFTITAKNGASLQGTVVAPAPAKIETLDQTIRHEINYHGAHRQENFPRTIVNITGGEFFYVVLTIQKGGAPAVKVAGDGPRAVATVGGQAVRYDGQKIVLDR
jgi:hypothetical protein